VFFEECETGVKFDRLVKRGGSGEESEKEGERIQDSRGDRLRREQEQVRAIWVILTAHNHDFHPIPVQLPSAYQCFHLLIRRERTRLVHPAFSHPLPVQHKFRRDRSPVGQNCARMSQSMTV
jgi:hypothetical protein